MPKLTPEQKIARLKTQYDLAQKSMDERRQAFRVAVSDYLDNGGSPTKLARELGVARGRIYQYRDSAREDAAAS